MASLTQQLMRRRALRLKRAGRKRKLILGRKSTPSYAELFAALGDPGQPAPKAAQGA